MDSAPIPSGERPDDAIPALELWKAQLAYVSGTILAWGAVLLQFWPVLARLQTGAHIHALGRDEGGDGTAMSFYLLALVVAVGLGTLALGAAPIVASLLAFAPVYAAGVILWRRPRRRGPKAGTGLAHRVGVRHLAVAYAALRCSGCWSSNSPTWPRWAWRSECLHEPSPSLSLRRRFRDPAPGWRSPSGSARVSSASDRRCYLG